MKKLFILLFFITLISTVRSQCKSGNCINGTGKMDFGWCVYEGNFVNGKADGIGTMTYDDYTYTGNFKNGVENGDGLVVYKDGHKENVRFADGQKVQGPTKLSAGEYKPLIIQNANCVSGDCINGFGTYVWPSGDKYIGNWKNYKREGAGTSSSPQGDQFTGTWHDNEKVEGTYKFPNGAVYIGTYTSDGNELNGTISLGEKHIPFVNGEARIPPAPKIVRNNIDPAKKTNAPTSYSTHTCPRCNGSGRDNVTDRYGNSTSQTCGLCHGARMTN